MVCVAVEARAVADYWSAVYVGFYQEICELRYGDPAVSCLCDEGQHAMRQLLGHIWWIFCCEGANVLAILSEARDDLMRARGVLA